MFDPVVSLGLSDTGQLFVGSRDPARIASFTMEGVFGGWIGREGSGPGEFRHVTDIVVSQDGGSIDVLDKSLRRITTFTVDGDYVWHVDMKLDHLGALSFTRHSSGFFIVVGAVRQSDDLVHVLDAYGRHVRSFGRLLHLPERLRDHAVAREQLLQGRVVELEGGDLLVALRAPLKVARFGIDGAIRWMIEDDLLPEPFGYLKVTESRYSSRFYPSVTGLSTLSDGMFVVFTAHFEEERRHGEVRSTEDGRLLRRWSFPFEAYPWRLTPSGVAVVHAFDPFSRFIVSEWEWIGEPSPAILNHSGGDS